MSIIGSIKSADDEGRRLWEGNMHNEQYNGDMGIFTDYDGCDSGNTSERQNDIDRLKYLNELIESGNDELEDYIEAVYLNKKLLANKYN